MPSGVSAGPSSWPSSFSSSEHKSDSSSSDGRSSPSLLPGPASVDPPVTADQVIEISISSDELPSWRRNNLPVHTGPMPWPGRTRSVLRRYSPLVPPAALLIILVVLLVQDLANADGNADSSDSPSANEAVIEWSACDLDNAVANAYNITAQCSSLAFPLCYDGICDAEDENATIAVAFKRIAAVGADSNSDVSEQTVWYLPDRPDLQTRSDVDLQMTLLYQELRGQVDIYTMDLRGSGNSTALACNSSDGPPLQSAIFARNSGVLQASDVRACVARLRGLGYTDFNAFSLASAARDIEVVVSTYQPSTHGVVYALGYGTLVAQQLMQRGISQVVGFVLDSALGGLVDNASSTSLQGGTDEYQVSKSDEDFGEVADIFLAWCQADSDCSEMFSNASVITTLNGTLLEVYDRLDTDTTSMCASILSNTADSSNSATNGATPPSFILRQLFAEMMESSTLRAFVPVLAYRFHRCGSEDLTLLMQFVNTTFETADEVVTPDLVFAMQAFSELWEQPSPEQANLTQRFIDSVISDGRVYTQLQSYCLFTGDTSPACTNDSTVVANSSATEGTLSYQRGVVNSTNVIPTGASVLLLSGGLDSVAPPKYAATLFDKYQGGDKALLVVANGTHGVVQSAMQSNGTACGRRVLASYVRNSGNLSAYDASCMTDLQTQSLAISNASSLLVLGVSDAYNGVFVSNTSSSGSSIGFPSSSSGTEGSTSSSSALDDLNNRISALENSRRRYEVALIVVGSVLGFVLICSAVVYIFRQRRKRQLADEEVMLRRMRGDEENEIELMRSIYLLSSSSPSSGERTQGARAQSSNSA